MTATPLTVAALVAGVFLAAFGALLVDRGTSIHRSGQLETALGTILLVMGLVLIGAAVEVAL